MVEYLKYCGRPYVERRTLNGQHDRGDIAGIPGVVIEVKAEKSLKLAEWIKEAEAERENDDANVGVVWHKRVGKADPGQWYVTMTGDQFASLLKEAGY